MQSIISSEIFVITLVAGVYLAALWLYRKTKLALLHPLLVSIPALVAVMSVIGMPYESFQQGSRMINFLLGPSVVALGYVLWEQVEYMKSNAVSIMTSIFVGSLVGIVSVICIARWMGADHVLIATLEPKSVTTPIAMGVAEKAGGIPAIAAVIVIVVGIFGGIVGPFVLNKLIFDSKIARGLSLGAAAHGLGTARAMELGALEGAISGLAIGLMGVMTAILVPVVEWVMSLF
ncbi:MAG: LrgB family protein [Butyricimonas paravirosa]